MLTTVTVRPLGPDDAAGLEPGDRIYVRDFSHADLLNPAAVERVRSKEIRSVDRSGPRATRLEGLAGRAFDIEYATDFGSSSSLPRIYSSRDALEAALGHATDREKALERMERPRGFVEDPDGVEMPLVPVYGSQATVGLIVPGVQPDELQRAVEQALLALYPQARLNGPKTRPVADIRVNVRTFADEPVAVNVLAAEAHFYASGAHTVEYLPIGTPAGA